MNLHYSRCIQQLTKLLISNICKIVINYESSYSSIISLLAGCYEGWKATRKGDRYTAVMTGLSDQKALLELSRKGKETI